MVVRMRHTRSHTGNRRSHHALKATVSKLCDNCGNPKLPHVACGNCGTYKKRVVVEVVTKAEKKASKAKAKK